MKQISNHHHHQHRPVVSRKRIPHGKAKIVRDLKDHIHRFLKVIGRRIKISRLEEYPAKTHKVKGNQCSQCPNDKNFSWYAKTMLPVVKKIKSSFPASDFILVSTADRAFRYGGEYKSAVGIDSLIKVQALLAYETGSSFYNQYEAMGGKNSIVDWARQKPSLANQDYVHPNHRGAEILANYFYEAVLNDYEKYLIKKK